MQAEIVVIGTELLLGQIIDTNAAYLAKQLSSIGVNLFYKSTVGDNKGRIVEVLKLAKVTVIHAFTTFLAQLGEVVRQKGYDPAYGARPLKRISTVSMVCPSCCRSSSLCVVPSLLNVSWCTAGRRSRVCSRRRFSRSGRNPSRASSEPTCWR